MESSVMIVKAHCSRYLFCAVPVLLLLAVAGLCGCGGSTSGNHPPPVVPLTPCPSCPDAIARENSNPGASDWSLHNPAANHEIEGFAGSTSVNRGGQINFYINTSSASYTLQVYRLGFYGGAGARTMGSPVTITGQKQPAPIVVNESFLLECPWTSSYTLTIPADNTGSNVWITGIYLAKIVTADTGKDSYIPFVVRDDSGTADLLFNSAVATYQAYNNWGGKSLYTYNSSGGVRAMKVSFDRPYQDFGGAGILMQYEFGALQFLEKNGYNVSYVTDIDLHEGRPQFKNHKAFVAMGHNEYWTHAMRDNVTAARDAGVNLAFFTGNTMEWQARLEPSTTSATADRVLVEYRSAALDPWGAGTDSAKWPYVTTRWRDAPVNDPEESLLGEMWSSVVTPNLADYVVQDGSNWVFAQTGLNTGSKIPNVIGREIDHSFGVVSVPGLQILASGNITANDGTADHADMTLYQAASGAYVFDAGSLLWPWTLDANVFWGSHPDYSSALAQQITANVLQKYGASPH